MEHDQQELRLPSSRVMAHLRPDGGGFEWELKEFDHRSKRWEVIDSGTSTHWAVAVADLAMAFDYLVEGMF